ncbi:MAG: hypothetical protein LBJ70_03700 [Holosporales bacterium]|nr:hypothetical protein [Holosporales bacterium]
MPVTQKDFILLDGDRCVFPAQGFSGDRGDVSHRGHCSGERGAFGWLDLSDWVETSSGAAFSDQEDALGGEGSSDWADVSPQMGGLINWAAEGLTMRLQRGAL